MGYCPSCDRLVSIVVAEVQPNGRYVYRPRFHENGGGARCRGGVIR